MKSLFLAPLFLLLAGCAGDQKNHVNQTIATPPAPFIVNPNGATTSDLGGLRSDLISASNQNQANLTGLVNTQVAKLAEKLVGVEASVDSFVKVQAEMTNTINARIDTTLQATANLRAEMNNRLDLNAQMNTNLAATTDMRNAVLQLRAEMNANVNALAQGQVGLKNDMTTKIESIKQDAQAGHDVNFFPKEAVDAIKASYLTSVVIVIGLAVLLTLLGFVMAYNARLREQGTMGLLMQALPHVPPEKARELMQQVQKK